MATNLSPYLGTKVGLGVPVSGSGPLTYQWRFNGLPIPGATANELIFSRVRVTNAGNYAFTASNQFGSITDSNCALIIRQLASWGDTSFGLTNLSTNLTNIIAIAAGYSDSLALRANGTVFAWGNGANTQTNVPAGLSNAVELAVGNIYNLALKTNGLVSAWGAIEPNFTNPLTNFPNAIAIEADIAGATILKTNGTVFRISLSGVSNSFPQLSNVVALAPAYNTFTALRDDGVLFIAGGSTSILPVASNVLSMSFLQSYGTILKRDGTIQIYYPLALIGSPTNFLPVTAIAANNGIRPDHTVAAWYTPGIGIPLSTTNVPIDLTNVVSIDTGANHILTMLALRDSPTVPLSDALDTPVLALSSRNSPQWFGQTNISHDGLHAAQSAEIGSGTASSMRAFVNGPITVSFWWKVSSEANHDFLTFSAAGMPLASISGEVDWQQVTSEARRSNPREDAFC